MSRKATAHAAGIPATDALEAAVRLLRRAQSSVLLMHAIGSVPFMLGLVYFVADMSRNAFAYERLEAATLGLAALYVWMKSWQAAFGARLRALLLQETPAPWTFGRVFRLVAYQAALQPLGLLVRPVALVITLPYVWTALFFHNVTVLGDGQQKSLRELCQLAASQARLWPRQAHAMTLLLFLFGVFIWANIGVTLALLPQMAKTFLGIETALSRHLSGLFNASFFCAVFAGTYLCIDPIRKAAVAVRCFHGNAVKTGADLEVQLRTLRPSLARAASVLGALLLGGAAPSLPAQSVAPAPAAPAVQPQDLSRSIDDVLARREFAWRLPRAALAPEEELGWFQKWSRSLKEWLNRKTWELGRWMGRIMRKIGDWLSPAPAVRNPAAGAWDWRGSVRYLLYGLLAISLGLLAVMIYRARKRLRSRPVAAEAIAAQPDLTREDVTADQLPEDGWLQMARELLQRGELRLALRASYLAGLAHLGQRELILLARHKSNRDYDRELRRRARGNADLIDSFERNLRTFEASWYGDHAVTPETMQEFTQSLERIRTC